jgi:hypothetical protein
MIYGTPSIRVENDQDDLIGIRTLVLSKLWQASRWPMTMEELDAEEPGVPEVPGGMLFFGRQRRPDRGGMRTSWTFRGVRGDGKGVTFKDRSNSFDYQFNPGFSQVDIKLLPNFIELRDEFGGFVDTDGTVIWPATITGNTSARGLGGGQDEERQNPMFGREDFLRVEGTYSFRYAAFNLSGAENGVGKIHETGALPGKPPRFKDRNWLKAPSPYVGLGVVNDVTEIYWLSGAGGWPEEIYGKLNL